MECRSFIIRANDFVTSGYIKNITSHISGSWTDTKSITRNCLPKKDENEDILIDPAKDIPVKKINAIFKSVLKPYR